MLQRHEVRIQAIVQRHEVRIQAARQLALSLYKLVRRELKRDILEFIFMKRLLDFMKSI